MKNIFYFLIFTLVYACTQELQDASPKEKEQKNLETAFSIETVNIGGVNIASTNCDLLQFRNGDPIPLASSEEEWLKYTDAFLPCAAHVNFDSTLNYGLVYNGFVVADDREFAPDGYHISSRKDWERIGNTIGAQKDTMAGLKSTKFWNIPGTNSTGFNALPTGYCVKGEWHNFEKGTDFWTNEPEPSGNDKMYYFFYMLNEYHLSEWYDHDMYGYCIRFVKDSK